MADGGCLMENPDTSSKAAYWSGDISSALSFVDDWHEANIASTQAKWTIIFMVLFFLQFTLKGRATKYMHWKVINYFSHQKLFMLSKYKANVFQSTIYPGYIQGDGVSTPICKNFFRIP
jgi:hypothetical protein